MSTGSSITAPAPRSGLVGRLSEGVADLGGVVLRAVEGLGDITLFAWQMLAWMFTRRPRRDTFFDNMYAIGVQSVPVVALIGTFTGMVLAVQSYTQFREFGLETQLGGVINKSMFRELGPVLAATMLAGRVGSAMAAELGTMRVTEQIDALASIGANPIQYLVVPRFLSCLLMIPSLTIMAVFMGVVGGAAYCISFLGIDYHHYRVNARALRRKLGSVLRHREEHLFRRHDRRDQLLPRLPLPPRRRGRRPRGDHRVRVFVRRDHYRGPAVEHPVGSGLPGVLASSAKVVWSLTLRRTGRFSDQSAPPRIFPSRFD